jgi:hypothetical protein
VEDFNVAATIAKSLNIVFSKYLKWIARYLCLKKQE